MDDFTGFWHGVLRLHVPLSTNPHVTMTIGGTTVHWEPGALWYGNFCLPHSVANRGRSERAHLVVDALITERLLALFPPADRPGAACADAERGMTFAVPGALLRRFMPALHARLGLRDGEWPVARIDRRGPRLMLRIAGVPAFRLAPLGAGTFRIANWSAGFSLGVPARGDAVTLAMRLARPAGGARAADPGPGLWPAPGRPAPACCRGGGCSATRAGRG